MDSDTRVLLLVETSYVFGRSLLRGIVRYSRLHEPWSLDIVPGHFSREASVSAPLSGRGVIARLSDAQATRRWHRARVPVIALEPIEERFARLIATLGLSEIRTDSRAIGRMAAEHLLERGFRHCAYCGIPQSVWSRARQEAFVERLAEADCPCDVYHASDVGEMPWERERPILIDYLRSLPRPTGVMACNDLRGHQVLEACRAADLQIPDDVAVVGVDDDDLMCQLSAPPLSSVALDLEPAGYEAAERLHQLIAGHVAAPQLIPVRPTHVVARRSTDTTVQDDPVVAQALRFIRDNATRSIQVSDVARTTRFSRRSLERRFAGALGHTILDEIVRRRIQRARRLLVETDLPMQQVAEVSGFANPKPMTRAFRHHEGVSPGEYRQRHRRP